MHINLPTPSTAYEKELNLTLTNYFRDIYAKITQQRGYAWNEMHPVMGSYHLWIDGSGRLRIKSSSPTSDSDGTVIGTQV